MLSHDGCPSIEPRFFRARFVRRFLISLGSTYKANLDTINSERAHNNGGEPSVLHKHTVDMCTGMTKKTLGTTLS